MNEAQPSAAPGEAAVTRGMEAQLGSLRRQLDLGALRVGWKVGLNLQPVQRQLGIEMTVVGHLTSDTRMDQPAEYSLAGATRPAAEPEVAAVMAADVIPGSSAETIAAAVGAYAAAIEVVDVDLGFDDVEPIVAGNVFHRAFVLGEPTPAADAEIASTVVRVSLNGTQQHEVTVGQALGDPATVLAVVAGRLEHSGEQLRAGDTVICGSLTPAVAVAAGDVLEVGYGPLGELRCAFSR